MALVTTVAEVLSLAWKLLHEVGVDKKKKKEWGRGREIYMAKKGQISEK